MRHINTFVLFIIEPSIVLNSIMNIDKFFFIIRFNIETSLIFREGLYLAKREEKVLQGIGYGIGGIIIVLSLIYLIVGVVVGLTYNKNMMRYNKTMMQQSQPTMLQPRRVQPAK